MAQTKVNDPRCGFYMPGFVIKSIQVTKHGKEYMQDYARVRVEEMDTTASNEIRACSACTDRSALEDFLFAYYYVGDTRNSTNHAMDTFEGFSEIMDDSDSSERMETIQQCIEYFLHCYDKVAGLIDSSKVNVVTITGDEVTNRANELYREEYKSKKWTGSKH